MFCQTIVKYKYSACSEVYLQRTPPHTHTNTSDKIHWTAKHAKPSSSPDNEVKAGNPLASEIL